ncbi:hypothetical protein TNCT_99981, partial [Trichonephila clavata]
NSSPPCTLVSWGSSSLRSSYSPLAEKESNSKHFSNFADALWWGGGARRNLEVKVTDSSDEFKPCTAEDPPCRGGRCT